MLLQNFIKLRSAVHELSWLQRKKISDDAENNTVVAYVGSNNERIVTSAFIFS